MPTRDTRLARCCQRPIDTAPVTANFGRSTGRVEVLPVTIAPAFSAIGVNTLATAEGTVVIGFTLIVAPALDHHGTDVPVTNRSPVIGLSGTEGTSTAAQEIAFVTAGHANLILARGIPVGITGTGATEVAAVIDRVVGDALARTNVKTTVAATCFAAASVTGELGGVGGGASRTIVPTVKIALVAVKRTAAVYTDWITQRAVGAGSTKVTTMICRVIAYTHT